MRAGSEDVRLSGAGSTGRRTAKMTRLTQNGLARILRRLRLEPKHFPYGRDHEHHFPDRGRAFHFD